MRSTQPHRVGMNRAPSAVLDRMLAGRKLGSATPGAGGALAGAMKRAGGKGERYRPRTSGNTRGANARY